MVEDVENFLVSLSGLVDEIKRNKAELVSKQGLTTNVGSTCKLWLNRISNSLRAGGGVEEPEINGIDAIFEKLLQLSSSPNRKSTYIKDLNLARKIIQKAVLIPLIKANRTSPPIWQGVASKITAHTSAEEKLYYDEAFAAAKAGCFKAAVVMTGCAIVDRLRKLVLKKGLPQFNKTSRQLKAATKGYYSKFNKEFDLKIENELQEVFDKDLVIVVSGMVALDLNQTKEILHLLETRNNCAHPSAYIADELAYAHFLNEANNLILSNPKLS
jgi:hypothetical protein